MKPTEISAASSKSDHIAMLFTSDIPMFVQMLFTTGSVLIGLTMYGSIIAITVIAALVLSIAVQHYATKEMSRLNDEWMGLADITQETILCKDEDRYKAYLERSMTNAIGFSQVDSYTWLFQGTLIGIVSVVAYMVLPTWQAVTVVSLCLPLKGVVDSFSEIQHSLIAVPKILKECDEV